MLQQAVVTSAGEAALLTLLPFIAIGFAAQLVDGALGMAFGVISSTLLISFGVPPAAASASVHAVEIFTTGASGLSHIAHRNVNWRLLARLAIPGVMGAVIGAGLIVSVDAAAAKPWVLAYLALMGLYLLWRGLALHHPARDPKVVAPLGLIGGFLDAAGGGGWGSVVTGNLLAQGAHPRQVIGTVNTAEFVVTIAVSATFIAALGFRTFTVATLGLLIGGLIAAPLGARMAKYLKPNRLLVLVGFVLTATSIFGIVRALG